MHKSNLTHATAPNRKRYEVTCDACGSLLHRAGLVGFQYRKRYEVTCDVKKVKIEEKNLRFQYRKRYEVTCDV